MLIRERIKNDYPPSVYLTRWKMKAILGFTDRLHDEWINKPNKLGGMGYGVRQIHLDFFDEAKRTMFLLKYGELIQPIEESNNDY